MGRRKGGWWSIGKEPEEKRAVERQQDVSAEAALPGKLPARAGDAGLGLSPAACQPVASCSGCG